MFQIFYEEFFNVVMSVSLVIRIIVFYEWNIILLYMISNHFWQFEIPAHLIIIYNFFVALYY
jgi:hypothetical protein